MTRMYIKIKRLSVLGIALFCLTAQSATVLDYMTVLSQYVKNPSQMGEIAPFTKVVGKELIKYISKYSMQEDKQGKYYLEAGGGCGAISICIAQKLRSYDHLDVIEINPELCKVLRKRLKDYKNVTVHCCSILDWHPGYEYNVIVCTLPFLSLGIDFTKQAMKYFKKVSGVEAIFSFVDYPIVKIFRSLAYDLRLVSYNTIAVQRYMDDQRDKYLRECKTIYQNIPSTNVYHMCFEV